MDNAELVKMARLVEGHLGRRLTDNDITQGWPDEVHEAIDKLAMQKAREILSGGADERKTVQKFLQLDGWTEHTGISGDAETSELFPQGYDLFGGEHFELRTSGPELAVRIHIVPDANREQVLALLEKLTDWYRDNPEMFGAGD